VPGTWSLTLKDGHRLRVSENMLLSRILGPKTEEVAGDWRRLRRFITCKLHPILLVRSNQGDEMDRASSTHGRNEKCVQNFG
jgi:hypothetical protein